MNWRVTYRGKSGNQEHLFLEADSRDGVFAALHERGVNAIRVEQIVDGARRTRRQGSHTMLIGALTTLVCISVGFAVWLWLTHSATPRTQPDVADKGISPNKIAAATPSQPTQAKPKEPPEEKSSESLGPQKVGEVRDGYVLLPNGKLHRRRGIRTVEPGGVDRSHPAAIFDHSTDNEFAVILTLRPGETLIGGPMRHGRDYRQSFLESLKTPIVVNDDDTEEVQALKRAVIETRLQMKEALDRGEDIGKIVEEAYVEAQKLSLYKDTLREQINEAVRNEDMTDEELDALVSAANMMLENKGIAPMKFGALTRARIRNLRK